MNITTLQQHHAGVVDGTEGTLTKRGLLWSNTKPNAKYQGFIDTIADGIEGIKLIVPSIREEARLEVIVDLETDIGAVMGQLIERTNAGLAASRQEFIDELLDLKPKGLADEWETHNRIAELGQLG